MAWRVSWARTVIEPSRGEGRRTALEAGLNDQVSARAKVAARVVAIAHAAPCQANRHIDSVVPARRHRSRHRIVARDAQMVTKGPALTPIKRAISRCGSLSVTDCMANRLA